MAGNEFRNVLGLGLLVVVGACSDATGPTSGDQVSVRFATVTPQAAQGSVQGGSLVLMGSNGTLRIDEMHIIVAEFELKRIDDACVDEVDHDECEEFEAPPSFIDVPLDGSAVLAVRQHVPPGTYRELDFEVEDLDDDEGDAAVAQQIAALRTQIHASFPDWPKDASMLVIGSFTPTGGSPIPFRVYFEAEIEVELKLIPPFVVGVDSTDPAFTVRIDPNVLFRNSDGTVRNLAPFDFAVTGQAIPFEVEIENGISKIEVDD